MTETTDIAAIRQRADDAKQVHERRRVALNRRAEMPTREAEDELDRLSDECAIRIEPLTADIAALLAHVDALASANAELARKLAATEAALREIVEFRASAYRQINDKYYPVEDVGEFLSGKFDDVCEIAASALAGNGGA